MARGSALAWFLTVALATAACGSKESSKPAAEPAEPAPEAVVPAPGTAASAGAPAVPDDPLPPEDEEPTDIPVARCPADGQQMQVPDKLLDLSADKLEALDFAAALACAEIAADLLPESVAAHHLRASALAGLGRLGEAQLAYTMALALDPDDPETLAATAHFHINVLPKSRDATMVGLEHAHRGSERAASRRRQDRPPRARLLLLEAQAHNDLARADLALPKVNEAIRLDPKSIEARYERGVALFNLCRFEEAGAAFKAVLRVAPDDPYAHHHLGLVYERDGREADARAHFKRAWEHPSGEFHKPVQITADEFDAELAKAVELLPEGPKKLLDGVRLEAADIPARADLVSVSPPFAPTILGLYRGLPKGMEGVSDAPARAIVLYRRNLARAVRTRAELTKQIRRTLLHEIGHVAGLDEDELRRRGLE